MVTRLADDSTAVFFPLKLPDGMMLGGYRACNPTVAWHNDVLWFNLRAVHYTLGSTEGGPFLTRNYMAPVESIEQLFGGRPLANARELFGPDPAHSPRLFHSYTRGLEDIRLVSHGGVLMANACTCQYAHNGVAEQVTAEIDVERMWAKNVSVHRSPYPEKNWGPMPIGPRLFYAYSLRPKTVLLEYDFTTRQCKVASETAFEPAFRQPEEARPPLLSGSSQWIPWGEDEMLSVVHERRERVYHHRFATMSRRDPRVRRLGASFYFREQGIEFCCGMAPMPDGGVIVTFGHNDALAWAAVLERATVERLLSMIG